jgi:phospholipid/cholesterol/gamma-HCH transport system substrate-binding protein
MVIVISALFIVGDGDAFFADHVDYKVILPNASGLKPGSKVQLAGVPVGSVSRIAFPTDLSSSQPVVTLSIQKEYGERIREDSYAWTQTEGLLGDEAIHVKLGTTDEPMLMPGSMIPYTSRPMLDAFAGQEIREGTTDLLKMMVSVLEDISAGKGTLGKLLKDPELYDNLSLFTESMAATTRQLQTVTREFEHVLLAVRSEKGMLGKLIFSEDYAASITKAVTDASDLVSDLRGVAAGVRSGEGSVGKLFTDVTLYEAGKSALETLAGASRRLDALLEKAEAADSVLARVTTDGKLGSDFSQLVARLDRSSESLERILGMVARGEGSVGRLVHDPAIAVSLGHIFTGVGEAGILRNVVRSAEEDGRDVYLRNLDLGRSERRELLRARALQEMALQDRDNGSSGVPVPASGPVDEPTDQDSVDRAGDQ